MDVQGESSEKAGFVSHFLVLAPSTRECERSGFVGYAGWRLYVLGNKTKIAHEHPINGFVSHFLLFPGSRRYDRVYFPDPQRRLRMRSFSPFRCFHLIPYCTKAISWRYYCCGDVIENKKQIWFMEA